MANKLNRNASNLAGVLAALSLNEKTVIEEKLSRFSARLPEGDVRRIWAEPVGRFGTDAMLYSEEQWFKSREPFTVDARGMSNGTLRFLGILTP
ncbi:MAG: ATPase, partial [Actinobacteria bacterium]|nr:ATPase [Actinomycetota bacterium]